MLDLARLQLLWLLATTALEDSVEVRVFGTLDNSTSILQGLQLLEDRINATEAFRLADNRTVKLRLQIADDKGDIEEIKRLYGEAVSSGVADLFLGPSTAEGSREAAKIVEAGGKVIMLRADPRPGTYEMGFQHVFSVNLLAPNYMSDGLGLLNISGARSVALVSGDDEVSTAICEGARRRAGELGLEVVANFSFDVGELSRGLRQAQAQGAQALLGCGSLEDEALAVFAARSLGFAPAAMLLSRAASPDFVETIGVSNANYLLAPATWDSRMDTGQACPAFGTAAAFAEMYRETSGTNATAEIAQAVAAGLALVAAFDGASWPVTDAADIATTLRALKMPSFYGDLAFSASGALARSSGATVQIQPLPDGGNMVALLGDDNLPLYPMPSWAEKDLEAFPCPAGQVPATEGASGGGAAAACEPCEAGRYARSGDARCRECAPAFYADTRGLESCKLCPTGADCPGTGTAEFPPARAGFHWEGGEFWECAPGSLCLGNNTCRGDNEGFLCAQCPTRQTQHSFWTHFIFTDWSCQECLAAPAQITLLVLVYVAAILYLSLLSFCVLASATSAHIIHSILWKKVVSHLTLITAVMEATNYGDVSQPLGLFAHLVQNPVALIDFECFVARDYFLDINQVSVLVGFFLIPFVASFLYLVVYITLPFIYRNRRLQFLRRMKKRQVRSEIKRQSFEEGFPQSQTVASEDSIARMSQIPVSPMPSGVQFDRPDRRYWVTNASSIGSSVCSVSIEEEPEYPRGAASDSSSSSGYIDPELGVDVHGRATSASPYPPPEPGAEGASRARTAESAYSDEAQAGRTGRSLRGINDSRRGSANSGSWDLMGLRQPTEDSTTPGGGVPSPEGVGGNDRRIRFNVTRHRSTGSTPGASGPEQSTMLQSVNSLTAVAANEAVAYASQQVQKKRVEVAGNAKHIINVTRLINKEAASLCTRLSVNVTYLLHPVAVRLLLEGVNCRKYDKWRSATELDVQCNNRLWVILCICGIVVYGFGIPLALMLRLYTLRRKLNTLRIRKRYGFLYNGFMDDKYYWEGYFMARKAVILSVVVVPGLLVRAYICLLLGFVFLAVQMHLNPYDNRARRVFHHLELVSLFSVLALIIMRILLVGAETVEETSPVFHDMLGPDALAYTLVAICILSQVCFFGLAASKLFNHGPVAHVLHKSRVVPESVGPLQRCVLRWLSPSRDRLEFKADTAELSLHELAISQREYFTVALCSTLREYILAGPTFHVGRVISAVRIATHETLEHDLDRLWRFHNAINRLQDLEQRGCMGCYPLYAELRFSLNQNTRYSLTPYLPDKWKEFKSKLNTNSVTVDDLAVTLMMCKDPIKSHNARFHRIDRHANPNPHLGLNQAHSREGTSHGDLSQSSQMSSEQLSESSRSSQPQTVPRGNSGALDPEEVLAVPMQVVGERGDFLLRMQRPALEREAHVLQMQIEDMKEQLATAARPAGSWQPSPLPSDAMVHVQTMSELPTREEEAAQAAAIIAERVQEDTNSEPVSPESRSVPRADSDLDSRSNDSPEPIAESGPGAHHSVFSPASVTPNEARTPNPWESPDEAPRPPPPMPPQPMQHGDPWEEPPEPPTVDGPPDAQPLAGGAPRQLWSPNPTGATPPPVPELQRAARRQAAFHFLAASVVPLGEPPQLDHEVWLPNQGSHEDEIHGDTHAE